MTQRKLTKIGQFSHFNPDQQVCANGSQLYESIYEEDVTYAQRVHLLPKHWVKSLIKREKEYVHFIWYNENEQELMTSIANT